MVLRGRPSEGAGVEMEKVDGSPHPPGAPSCAGPRVSSCCPGMQLQSAGLSEVCWTASSFCHWLVHSGKMNKKLL